MVAAAWICVAAWMALILSASGETFAESRTTPWIASALRFAWVELTYEGLLIASVIVRKATHFVEYAVLSLLCFRAARLTWPAWPIPAWALLALALAVFSASVDETLQSSQPTRTGAPKDVLIDGCGASLAALIAGTLHRRRAGAVVHARASRVRGERAIE